MVDEWLNGRLIADERILWSGRPVQGLMFTPRDVFLIPFSLAWCGFAIFWLIMATSVPNTPVFFPLFGVPFVGIGLFFVAGRFIVDLWVRRRVYYAVTNRRILIGREEPFGSFTAINLNQLPDIQVSGRAGGRGTIRFGAAGPIWGNRGMRGWIPSIDSTPQFLGIEDANRVFDLIQHSL